MEQLIALPITSLHCETASLLNVVVRVGQALVAVDVLLQASLALFAVYVPALPLVTGLADSQNDMVAQLRRTGQAFFATEAVGYYSLNQIRPIILLQEVVSLVSSANIRCQRIMSNRMLFYFLVVAVRWSEVNDCFVQGVDSDDLAFEPQVGGRVVDGVSRRFWGLDRAQWQYSSNPLPITVPMFVPTMTVASVGDPIVPPVAARPAPVRAEALLLWPKIKPLPIVFLVVNIIKFYHGLQLLLLCLYLLLLLPQLFL